MQFFLSILVSLIVLIAGGCAGVPQAPVALVSAKIAKPSVRVGVAMAPLPKADTFFPGADCLLCMAAAGIANSSLTSHTQTLLSADLKDVQIEIANLLRKKGASVKLIEAPFTAADLPSAKSDALNFAKKDFSGEAAKHDIDKLVVINIVSLGVQRTYSAYFPTSEPKAYVRGIGYMVNLADNSYDWFAPINYLRASDGIWDEPPKFPGLTNAYFQAVEAVKDELKRPFAE